MKVSEALAVYAALPASADKDKPLGGLLAGPVGPVERRTDHVLPVRLVAGSACRSALCLSDHPEAWHRQVVITGRLEPYFTVCGIREVAAYRLTDDAPADGAATFRVSAQTQLIQGGR